MKKIFLPILIFLALTGLAYASPNNCSNSCPSAVTIIPSFVGHLDSNQSFVGPSGSGNIGPQTPPLFTWELQVGSIGGTATSWTVVLEGSTDGGVHWGPILTHTKSVDGEYGFKVDHAFGVTDFRINVLELTLGTANSVGYKIYFK